MAPPQRADWLERAIRKAKPGKTPRADFDAWRAAHPKAIAQLKRRGAQISRPASVLQVVVRLGTDAARSPMARLAVAASLFVGIALLAIHYMHVESAPTTETAQRAPGSMPSESEVREKELAVAKDLFIQGDSEGLLALLDTARPQTIVIIAAYLGRIGDASCLPTLDAFAARWQGTPQDNPFSKAAAEIRFRREQSGVTPIPAQHPPATNVPLVGSPSPARAENRVRTCRGVVIDQAGRPIEKASVRVQCCARDQTFTDVTTPFLTDREGRFSLTVPADNRKAGDRLYVLCERSGYALGWRRLPADQETTRIDQCQIVLYRPTIVAGMVIDATGQPIPEALVEARIVTEHNPFGSQEYPFLVRNGRANRTDAAGRFTLLGIPANSRLILRVSRQDYASRDSREGEGQYRNGPMGEPIFVDPEAHNVRAGQQNLRIVLAPARYVVEGQIAYDDGAPCEEEVTILCTSPCTSSDMGYGYTDGKWALWDPLQRGHCSSVQRGRFTIKDLPAGTYWVAAAEPASGDLITPPEQVTVYESQWPPQVALKVCRTTEVRVRVVEKTHGPVRDVLVVAESRLPMQRHTDPNGGCVFHLVPGGYTFHTYGGVQNSTTRSIQVTPGAKNLQVEIPVSPRPLVQGRLIDESGRPARGSVCLFRGQRVSTDAQGRFAIPRDQTPESVGLARDAARTRARLFLWKRTDLSGELEIRVEPLATVLGRVLDEYGMPLTRIPVAFSFSAWEPGTQISHRVDQLLCRTPLVDGRYEFEVPVGLPVGLRADAYTCGGGSINPVAGQTYDLGDTSMRIPPSVPNPKP